MRFRPLAALAAVAVGLLTLTSAGANPSPPIPAASTFETKNLKAVGHSFFPNTPNLPGLTFTANSDLAFWGKLAFQGHYTGFRILDVSSSKNPKQISFTECVGNQGDVVVWGDILVRSWNSPATGTGTSLLSCDGEPVPMGFEGLHVFDISDLKDPELIGEVELSARPMASRALQNGAIGCGSHTATLVPDKKNDRLLLYNQTSGGPCPFISIIEIPLDAPEDAKWLRDEPLEEAGACHDSGVILGKVKMLACASHDHANVYSLGGKRGGSLEDPEFLYTISEEGVCNEPGNPLCNGNWHSAAFTWDGKVIILGWEPGGGSAPECEATDPDVKKSWFFYDAKDGSKLGQFVLPRPQTAEENCTIHNYNVVPTKKGYILVGGNYQAGISVVDFSKPSRAKEIAYADPAPLVPTQLGGDWSTYWYNGDIYQSDITRGLLVWDLKKNIGKTEKLRHLNPQTNEFSFGGDKRGKDKDRDKDKDKKDRDKDKKDKDRDKDKDKDKKKKKKKKKDDD